MPMEIDRGQIKAQARQAMSLTRPSFWIVTLVYILMTTGISSLANFTTGTLGLFLSFAVTMYCWVVGFSYRLWAIWTARRLDPDLGSLLEGFSVAGRVIMMELSILARVFGWTFLLAIPVGLLIVGIPSPVLMTLATVAMILGLEVIILRYSMSYYVLADYPDLGPAVAIAHSIRLTKGWIWELVKLHLSFAGWYILSYGLTCAGLAIGAFLTGDLGALMGLPYDEMLLQLQTITSSPLPSLIANIVSLPVTLYLTPYVEVTLAQFYDARIHLSDNMADPLGGMQMPPV